MAKEKAVFLYPLLALEEVGGLEKHRATCGSSHCVSANEEIVKAFLRCCLAVTLARCLAFPYPSFSICKMGMNNYCFIGLF